MSSTLADHLLDQYRRAVACEFKSCSNTGEGESSGSHSMSTAVHKAHGAQINFGDLIPYLIYGYSPPSHFKEKTFSVKRFRNVNKNALR
jgi:hypothetical protein